MLLKDEIRRKDKVIDILFENFSNCVAERSNYITSKNAEVSTQTDQQTKNDIQTYTANNNHRTVIASTKENGKNRKKSSILIS